MMAFHDRMFCPPSDARAAAVEDISAHNNVVLIPYSILTQNKKVQQNPPFGCRGCGAILSYYSKVLNKDAYYQKMVEEEFPEELDDIKKAEAMNKASEGDFIKGKFIKDLEDNQRAWICEYCDVHNKVPADVVVPETEDQLYLIKKGFKAPQVNTQEETKLSDGPSNVNLTDETSIVFCIDVSGSMSSTHETNYDGKKSQVSRMKLISDAVLRQIETMKETHPNRKVGLILFGSVVTLKGDCKEKEVVITNDLENFGKLLSYSKLKGQTLLKIPLCESFNYLSSTVKKIQAGGGTALGPALLCGIGLAQGKAGSKVILCTDGLANVGLGVLENPKDPQASQEFYDKVGDLAAQSGIAISIITIQGNACRVDALGPLTDKTAGTITRVDPANFDLSEVASNNLIATNVKLKVIIHEALSFQNESEASLHNNNSILMKEVGSVSENNEVYFEYRVKNNQELKKENMNLETLEWLPLQSQIMYRDLTGNEYLRVICKKQELTHDQNEVGKQMKAEVLAGYVQQQNANLVLKGKISEAKKQNLQWANYVHQVAGSSQLSESNKKVLEGLKVESEEMQELMVQTEAVQQGKNLLEKDEIASKWYEKKQKKKK